MSTKVQRWAQERNFAKFRIKGMAGLLRSGYHKRILTIQEQQLCSQAAIHLEDLLFTWDLRNPWSKQTYMER